MKMTKVEEFQGFCKTARGENEENEKMERERGFSETSPLDPIEQEKLRNKCWLQAVGGRYKGQVYGIGHVDSQDECVDSYMQQTESSSSQQVNVEEFNELQTILVQSESRLANSESRLTSSEEQIRHITSQFQTFIGAIIQYLPPLAAATAQSILQTANQQNQPQHNREDQQEDQLQHPENPYKDY
ncbi:hypothetical protein VIGAN_06134600 [Vigna angularis var. angularis]|uniref:Uncharacterized protein n=1 Tax=Vigna angularis var. angularis TaxID=157739 RepID=A0A0S3SBC1_PHAAN|nr:hypothetical protein VIGAN_06134600 [Vigna angularis var. angularis]